MKNRILFLVHKMSLGFGVSVVVDNLSRELKKRGVFVAVACIDHDDTFSGYYPIHTIEPTVEMIDELILDGEFTHVAAHTTPFFELLPAVSGCQRWVWEHGDPTPELFPFDGPERRKIADRKRHSVYPEVERVIAISDFIRSDIQWLDAEIIYNGYEHTQVAKRVKRKHESTNKLKVGTLMRLGAGEAFYKGNKLLVQLIDMLAAAGGEVEFHLMGRGSDKDAEEFVKKGVTVHLNATDEERAEYLASLDIFVSLSLWEGFNLPLLEAGVSGALPLALDTGAHPEVTPYICSNISEMKSVILTMTRQDRAFLSSRAIEVQKLMMSKFSWGFAANRVLGLMKVATH